MKLNEHLKSLGIFELAMPMISIIVRIRVLPTDAELESVPLGRDTGIGDNVVNDGFLGVGDNVDGSKALRKEISKCTIAKVVRSCKV